MSAKKKKYKYLQPEINVAERLQETKNEHKSTNHRFVHWGISGRVQNLQAILDDQRDNLHSLIFKRVCSCGLKLVKKDATTLDLVLSNRHRNHLTLEPDLYPKFRGMVQRGRLFALWGPNPTDEAWNDLVFSYIGKQIRHFRHLPLIWEPVRDFPRILPVEKPEADQEVK